MIQLPHMIRVQQHHPRPRVSDIPATVHEQLAQLNLHLQLSPNQTVAISAGSRGVANIHIITKAIVDFLKALDVKPFVVPAMGSHGGGTVEGQCEILASYGMTEAFLGCPIRATMDTVEICETEEGIPVHFDRFAFDADHVIVVNRIKPHTHFIGDIESGLMKMMLIGLGKHAGARIYHQAIQDMSFDQIVRSVAGRVLELCPILAGVAIVENAYDDTACIEAVRPDDFERRETELLKQAKEYLPCLPFQKIDVLLIDAIGKNISGAGLDTNVVGRKQSLHAINDRSTPQVRYICVRGLTEETHGNAAGIGLVEFCHSRVIEQMNVHVTRTNCLTGGGPMGAMLPLDYPSDREMLEVALSGIGLKPTQDAGIVWIRDTLHVCEFLCSTAYLDEVEQMDDMTVISEPTEIKFDAHGDLLQMKPSTVSV